jgi:hypothetical protein
VFYENLVYLQPRVAFLHAALEKKTKREGKEKNWMKKINQASGHDHKVVKIRSTILSPLSCGSTIFAEIALISVL